MELEKFLETLTEIMDTEENLTLETILADVPEWDSVSMVSFFSFCSVNFPTVKVLPEQIKTAKTVKDLWEIVEEK